MGATPLGPPAGRDIEGATPLGPPAGLRSDSVSTLLGPPAGLRPDAGGSCVSAFGRNCSVPTVKRLGRRFG